MSLTVNVNSYVSLEEANAYIEQNYRSQDAVRVKWSSFTNADKEVLLRKSTTAIDGLEKSMLSGGRQQTIAHQPLAFPRYQIGGFVTNARFRGQPEQFVFTYPWPIEQGGEYGGLLQAKAACIENALYMGYFEDTVVTQLSVGIRGIKSVSTPDIKEEYSTHDELSNWARKGIYTEKVFTLLQHWISSARSGF